MISTIKLSLEAQLRYVGELYDGVIPDYFSADARLSYRVSPAIEVSVIGENLLKKRRAEYTQRFYPTPIPFVPRSVAVQTRFRF